MSGRGVRADRLAVALGGGRGGGGKRRECTTAGVGALLGVRRGDVTGRPCSRDGARYELVYDVAAIALAVSAPLVGAAVAIENVDQPAAFAEQRLSVSDGKVAKACGACARETCREIARDRAPRVNERGH